MFEIESKSPDEITFITKKTTIKFNIADAVIDAGLAVGKIAGPGEFEIGDATIRGIATESGKTIYDVEIGGVHTGIIGGIEENLDDIVFTNLVEVEHETALSVCEAHFEQRGDNTACRDVMTSKHKTLVYELLYSQECIAEVLWVLYSRNV